VFTFIQADIRGNIAVLSPPSCFDPRSPDPQGLRKRVNKHRDPTLEALLAAEDNNATGCLVRLIRYVCQGLLAFSS
jgi:hypothetical protein